MLEQGNRLHLDLRAAGHTVPVKDANQLGPTEIGLLRGGQWAAVQTALAMLAARGRIDAGPSGFIRRTGGAPPEDQELERAVFSAFYGTMGAREVANQPRVRRLTKGIEKRLVRQGYLRAGWVRILLPTALLAGAPCVVAWLAGHGVMEPRVGVLLVVASVSLALWFLPRRTWFGGRLLGAARARCGSLADMINDGTAAKCGAVPDVVGLGVALFGGPALLAFLPRMATDAGLLDGGNGAADSTFLRRNPDGGAHRVPPMPTASSEVLDAEACPCRQTGLRQADRHS
jgi:uncharacterized protein (TIGR04222 family)